MGSRANSGTNKCSIAQLGGRAVLMPSCLFNGGGEVLHYSEVGPNCRFCGHGN